VLSPERVKSRLYDDITPLNVIRVVLSEIFQADLPPRQDRSIYSSWSKPYQYTDVTAKVEQPGQSGGNPEPR
jgi:hypothetical protein